MNSIPSFFFTAKYINKTTQLKHKKCLGIGKQDTIECSLRNSITSQIKPVDDRNNINSIGLDTTRTSAKTQIILYLSKQFPESQLHS
jgi:hypothetical protein